MKSLTEEEFKYFSKIFDGDYKKLHLLCDMLGIAREIHITEDELKKMKNYSGGK